MTSTKSEQPLKKEDLTKAEFIAMLVEEFEWEKTMKKADMRYFEKGLKTGMEILNRVLEKKGIDADIISRIIEMPTDAKRYRYPDRGRMGIVRTFGGTIESLL